MVEVLYKRAGCEDLRFFKSHEEFEEWLTRQLVVAPDTIIVSIKER